MQQTVMNINAPSLLRQIVDEVDMMTEEQKAQILRKIKMQKAASSVRRADEILKSKPIKMTEEELCEMVSNNRKKWYEEEQQK